MWARPKPGIPREHEDRVAPDHDGQLDAGHPRDPRRPEARRVDHDRGVYLAHRSRCHPVTRSARPRIAITSTPCSMTAPRRRAAAAKPAVTALGSP